MEGSDSRQTGEVIRPATRTDAAEGRLGTLADWLALHRAPGVGPSSLLGWVRILGSPGAVLEAGRRGRLPCCPPKAQAYFQTPDWNAVERELRWLESEGHSAIMHGTSGYPQQLAAIPAPPLVLYACGDASLAGQAQLAVVGSRAPTAYGRRAATWLAGELVQAGLTVTSGLATGIDACAHRAALECGGRTIAVAGCGLDRTYPASNRNLAERIASDGLLLSEFPLGAPPLAGHFPRRNRIISGLAVGTLVVEAGRRSGSLITARYALEQGREVFAVPGSVFTPVAKGCHDLLRQGAKLVETIADILEELPRFSADPVSAGAARPSVEPASRWPQTAELRGLLEDMGDTAVSPDELAERSGLTIRKLFPMLCRLEIDGYVHSQPDGNYCRIR